jgi:hypothetical protein
VLGPLALYAEPHCYDLCGLHADRLTAPRGWEVLRLALPEPAAGPGTDELSALADAVREPAREALLPEEQPVPRGSRSALEPPLDATAPRRGHLRILREQP